MRAALEANVPFLAIGRGLHVLTVARGGTLTQDLPGHRADRARYAAARRGPRRRQPRSAGCSAPGSRCPPRTTRLLYQLGDGLTVTGWSPDGEVTEALEVAGHRFGVGVHWHPEEGDDPRLLTAFVEAAAEPRPRGAPTRREPRKPVAVKPKAGAAALRPARPSEPYSGTL